MTSATARVPAKINLCLGVGPVRDDGFHSLATVYQALDIQDEVRAVLGSYTKIDEKTRAALILPKWPTEINKASVETLAKTCDLGQFDGSEAQLIGHTDTVGGADRDRLKAMFRYAQSQLPLLRDFDIAVALAKGIPRAQHEIVGACRDQVGKWSADREPVRP